MRVFSRQEKVDEWTSRLERYELSGQTVAEFCHAEEVSAASFYQWKKRLRGGSRKQSVPGFAPVHVTSIQSSSTTIRSTTVARLGSGVEIEFGSDLRVVESIVRQLLSAPEDTTVATGASPC